MTAEPKVITGPVREPVSLADAKSAIGVDVDYWDQLFTNVWIPAARDYFEAQASCTICEQTLEATWDAWPSGAIVLPRTTPLIEIVWFIARFDDDTSTTVPATDYLIDAYSMPARIVRKRDASWPSETLQEANGISIKYRAGMLASDATDEPPEWVKYPILMLVGGMYENRESETFTDRAAIQAVSMKYGVEAWIQRARDKFGVVTSC